MILFVNGQRSETQDRTTLSAFLDQLGLPRKGIAIERNLEIVPKSAFDDVFLAEGDRLEIVQFVGGG